MLLDWLPMALVVLKGVLEHLTHKVIGTFGVGLMRYL